MLNTLPATAKRLQAMPKQAAKDWILDAVRVGDISWNECAALASECGIELQIIPVDPRD
jgi:hypothetical protein